MRRFLVASFIALLGMCSACSGEPEETEPECVELPASCTPRYNETFANVFDNTLKSCGTNDSCHSQKGRNGGLAFTDMQESYQLLRGMVDGKVRVKPGNPACSKLIVRTHSVGKPWQMPPGIPLESDVQCAIRKWVEAGAEPAPIN